MSQYCIVHFFHINRMYINSLLHCSFCSANQASTARQVRPGQLGQLGRWGNLLEDFDTAMWGPGGIANNFTWADLSFSNFAIKQTVLDHFFLYMNNISRKIYIFLIVFKLLFSLVLRLLSAPSTSTYLLSLSDYKALFSPYTDPRWTQQEQI